MESDEVIHRATLLRVGAVTHNIDAEARFFGTVTIKSKIVTLRSPANANIAPPGYYMLFVWNSAGVPSVARIIRIG
ncbi:MAG TPA: galactose oxidase early set domain-containing protein [Nitrosomonas sp.]|nr:galactose oxidase early set domain-containing protein [Nitrosomonas sp.]